jgi:enolase-phosphatase E1
VIADPSSGVRVVLLDIEGTTTPIAFVHETLFTFARERLDRYLASHWADSALQEAVRKLANERAAESGAAPEWKIETADELRASAAAYVRWLMDGDRKSPGLKELQGLIWEDGYRDGHLRGVVWEDVPDALKRWRHAGLRIAIYSSGSELAQRRLFESTAQGDLTPMISAFFDTRVGGKLSPDSYDRIAKALEVAPGEMCFVSDVAGELAAAATAGCRVVLSARPGNPPQSGVEAFPMVTSFEQI